MKATKATLKAFLRKNKDVMFRRLSYFDGMYDGVVDSRDNGFERLEGPFNPDDKNRLGFAGLWFTSNDLITPYNKEGMRGFEIYNSCGSFVLAVKDP
jgi:hypothetical protein